MILLRNIAFYVVFYLGSVIYVLSAVAVAPVSRPALGAVVAGWCGYHRGCARAFDQCLQAGIVRARLGRGLRAELGSGGQQQDRQRKLHRAVPVAGAG